MVVLHRTFRRRLGLLILLVLPWMASCSWLNQTKPLVPNRAAPSLLQSTSSTESVGIEVFTIRVSLEQDSLFRQLWQEADEQMLDPALRRDLLGHGLRVGFLGESLSPSLSRLINVTSAQTPETNFGDFREVSVAELSKDLSVTRQYVNLLPEMRASLKVFDDNLPEFSRMWTENGHLCGQTYKDVQGLIQVTGVPLNTGRARLTVMPVLEYGVPERRVRVHSGVTFNEIGRPRHQYKSLSVSMDLLPGQWMILGPISRETTGAGRAFFVRGSADGEQKMMAIRLAKMKSESSPGLSVEKTPRLGYDVPLPERN